MEMIQDMRSKSINVGILITSSLYKPTSYKEMDEWLNSLSSQAWTAILGQYASGGFANVVLYMKEVYGANIIMWRDKDLRHYWNSRKWSDFKTRAERFAGFIK